MKKKKLIWATLLMITLSSCASHHSTMRGSVAMKIDESTAHVCLGDNEVKPGDRVVAYKNMCSNSQSDKPSRSKVSAVCTKEKIGGGTVVSNLNQHYSEVKFDTGVPFEEGTIVEVEK